MNKDSQEQNGKITSVENISSIRNRIETGIKRKGNKAVNSIFIILASVIVFGGIAMTVLNFGENSSEEKINLPTDEALKTKSFNDNSLAAQMAAIKKQEAEKERLQKEIAERERQLKEQQERERLEKEKLLRKPSGDTAEFSPAQRRLDGNTLIELGDNSNSNPISSAKDKLNEMLAGESFETGTAKLLPDRSLLLIHGTQIPCALQTRLVTDQPSVLICQVTKNIFSADGTTLLIERGSKVVGEQKKAIITGQNMAFVNWSTIDTPNGVRIKIDSLGTDSLGAAGMSVWVDEKWGQRFGSAILLSFIQDALATASSALQRSSSGNIVYDNSERNTGRMAEIALENSINIQPTGYAPQGQLFNILVVRDIDFSTVYRLKDPE